MVYFTLFRVAGAFGGLYSCMSRRGEDFISGCDPGGVGCGDLSCDDRLMMVLHACLCVVVLLVWCVV